MARFVPCALCGGEFHIKHEVIRIGKKFICTGCAEAIHYAFWKGCLNPEASLPPLNKMPKDWVKAMEWRLAGKPKKRGGA